MNVETQTAGAAMENGGCDMNRKRTREEGAESDKVLVDEGGSKKPKVEKSIEVKRTEEELEVTEDGVNGEKGTGGPVSMGPKSFGSSVEMFDYFYNFLHYWTPNFNVNSYENKVLLKKGHREPEKKIGKGIHVFQVWYHPQWKIRCFFIIRDEKSVMISASASVWITYFPCPKYETQI